MAWVPVDNAQAAGWGTLDSTQTNVWGSASMGGWGASWGASWGNSWRNELSGVDSQFAAPGSAQTPNWNIVTVSQTPGWG